MTKMKALPLTAAHTAIVVLVAIAMFVLPTTPVHAASKTEINAEVEAALQTLEAETPGTRELAKKAAGVLVFPKILKAGFLLGVQGGHGALLEHGKTEGYYESVAVSYGLQAGVESFGYALFFMSKEDLDYFHRSQGFELGSAPSLVVADQGFATSLSTTTLQKGIIAFFFSEQGLMGGLGVEGTKITRIHPD
jgi:lipid-binding SYLF domain-containing protein